MIIALYHISGIFPAEIKDVSEIVDGTMNVPPDPMAMDDLANRISSFVSAGVNDCVPMNGS